MSSAARDWPCTLRQLLPRPVTMAGTLEALKCAPHSSNGRQATPSCEKRPALQRSQVLRVAPGAEPGKQSVHFAPVRLERPAGHSSQSDLSNVGWYPAGQLMHL